MKEIHKRYLELADTIKEHSLRERNLTTEEAVGFACQAIEEITDHQNIDRGKVLELYKQELETYLFVCDWVTVVSSHDIVSMVLRIVNEQSQQDSGEALERTSQKTSKEKATQEV